jgi:hypothetical protein
MLRVLAVVLMASVASVAARSLTKPTAEVEYTSTGQIQFTYKIPDNEAREAGYISNTFSIVPEPGTEAFYPANPIGVNENANVVGTPVTIFIPMTKLPADKNIMVKFQAQPKKSSTFFPSSIGVIYVHTGVTPIPHAQDVTELTPVWCNASNPVCPERPCQPFACINSMCQYKPIPIPTTPCMNFACAKVNDMWQWVGSIKQCPGDECHVGYCSTATGKCALNPIKCPMPASICDVNVCVAGTGCVESVDNTMAACKALLPKCKNLACGPQDSGQGFFPPMDRCTCLDPPPTPKPTPKP